MGKRVYNLPIAKTAVWCYNKTNPIPKGTQEIAVMNHKLFASEYYFYFSFVLLSFLARLIWRSLQTRKHCPVPFKENGCDRRIRASQ